MPSSRSPLPDLCRSLLLLCVFSFVTAGCGGDDGPPSQALSVVEYGRVQLRPTDEAAEGDLHNRFLSPGAAFEVREYEVPELPCVRTDSQDYLHIPEVTSSPGAAAVVYAVPPADASKPVLLAFHGNGLDFIEAEASLFTHAAPDAAEQLLASQPDLIGYIEILSRTGAIRGVEGEFGNAYVAEALERGWGVVAPGNCWGDGGHHSGEVVDYYVSAPRYGRTMDDGVWAWFRQEFPHDTEREYSFGCSGGGQRTVQLLLHDERAVAASGIDSPADYLPGFKDDPPGLFGLLSRIPGYLDVLDNFYIEHYGSVEAAAAQSLGTQLLARDIALPIYLTYSERDTFATNGITSRLVEALQARQPADRAVVWNTGEAVHCQINTRDRAGDAIDWLSGWTRGS